MTAKYEFIAGKTRTEYGITLRQIRDLATGKEGGWIEGTHNLQQHGKCFVWQDAVVCGQAQVKDNAQIFNAAHLYGNAIAQDAAWVFGFAQLFEHAQAHERCRIFDYARVHGQVQVFGSALVFGRTNAEGHYWIYGKTQSMGHADINGYGHIYGKTMLQNKVEIRDGAEICNCIIRDTAYVGGEAIINGEVLTGNAKVTGNSILPQEDATGNVGKSSVSQPEEIRKSLSDAFIGQYTIHGIGLQEWYSPEITQAFRIYATDMQQVRPVMDEIRARANPYTVSFHICNPNEVVKAGAKKVEQGLNQLVDELKERFFGKGGIYSIQTEKIQGSDETGIRIYTTDAAETQKIGITDYCQPYKTLVTVGEETTTDWPGV